MEVMVVGMVVVVITALRGEAGVEMLMVVVAEVLAVVVAEVLAVVVAVIMTEYI